jgi:hypothetical protein
MAITDWENNTKEPLANTKQKVNDIEKAAEDLYDAWN